MNNKAHENFLSDSFLGGQLKILQPKDGYRAGSDAVLLAAAIPLDHDQSILEVGCGVGTASLCLAARARTFYPQENFQMTGLDIQTDLIDLAKENAQQNKLEIDFQCMDLRTSCLAPQSYGHVFANPPYFSDHAPSPHVARSTARSETAGTLEEWVKFCIKMAKPRGYVTFIYPTDRLGELIHLCEPHLGGLRLLPLWPRPHTPSKRFILQGRKDVDSPAKLLPGLILHTESGEYTPATRKILWDGMDLVF
jgi:tRNA1(Val) A37 N6-methylase TrmN6